MHAVIKIGKLKFAQKIANHGSNLIPMSNFKLMHVAIYSSYYINHHEYMHILYIASYSYIMPWNSVCKFCELFICELLLLLAQ